MTTSGGASRIVLPWVSLASTPRSIRSQADLRPVPQRRVDVDAGPQAQPADRGDAGADELGEPAVQVRAESRARAPARSPVASSPTTVRPTAQASGLPPKVEPCWPGWSTPSTSPVGHHGGDRHDAAAEGLAEQVDVGDDAGVLAGQGRAGPRPRPDWISSAISSTSRRVQSVADRGQVAGGRDDHAGLALDRLEQHGHGVVVDRGLERGGVAVRARCGSPG